MKKRYKRYLKANVISIFFLAVSFISITMAWFAYSGLARTSLDINVKSWYIEFDKDNKAVSNDIIIDLDEIYPGMQTVAEKINIKNMGDSEAQINYEILSARILDENIDIATIGMMRAEDKLAHDYPFHINIGLTKNVAVSQSGTSELNVSISWPLDSDNDKADSMWGTKAYDFIQRENIKAQNDSSYQINSPVRIVISIKAEQLVDDIESYDSEYLLGNTILYDIEKNTRCQKLSDTCIKTNVLDVSNKKGDETVTLYPIKKDNYGSAVTRPLTIEDALLVIAKDVDNSFLVRNNLSDSIIGTINNEQRLNTTLNYLNDDSYFKYNNERFDYLASTGNVCLASSNGLNYSMQKIDDISSKIAINSSACETRQVIIANKESLKQE